MANRTEPTAAPSELASLLMLADGRLPTGGHANGCGIEWAAARDDLGDPATLLSWIEARLQTSGRVEAGFAVAAASPDRSVDVLDLELTARLLGPRAREVSRQLGRQLLRLARQVWPNPRLEQLSHPAGPHHALVFGTTAGLIGADPVSIATLVLHHQVAASITATIRLLGSDPIELSTVQAHCGRLITEIAGDAPTWADAAPSELPSRSMPLAEVLVEDHGTWNSRLFVA
jgi:urease accessory protein